jgi:hypothetical protein
MTFDRAVATWDDVREAALALPEAVEGASRGQLTWSVAGKSFAWERPLRKADLAVLGDAAPAGAILGVHVPDLGAKEALLANEPEACFTTPHFDGFKAVLVQLDVIPQDLLAELLVESWLARAPKRLARGFRLPQES